MNDQRYDREDFNQILSTLQAEGIVLLPSISGWHMGALATSDKGVAKLLSLLHKMNESKIELLLDNPSKLSFYLDEVPEVAFDLIELSEKPLTLLLEGARRLSDVLLKRGEFGFRIINEPFLLPLCSRLRQPILISPPIKTTKQKLAHFSEIDESILEQVDYVSKYGQESVDEELISPSIIRLSRKGEIEIIKK